jgi:NAD(P)-dependent dehydrogenase (short-subunit alcohol dehydrogenase family)
MTGPFDQHSTTTQVIAGVDLSTKTAVVTGGSAGLGIETGRTLAAAGARVVMVGRDAAKLAAAAAGIRADTPGARIEEEIMDLADLASIRAAAQRLLLSCPQINILINNAGVMACPLGHTRDGFELQFGTNHLGHFLFTCLLAPSLVAGAPARVVSLSSGGHKLGSVDFDDPNFSHRDYDKWASYGQSKTANALFAVALNKRLAGRGVTANAVHPGMIMTELGRHLEAADIEALQAASVNMEVGFKTVPAGAATSVWAATAAQLEGIGGLYLEDCHIGEAALPGDSGGFEPHAVDPASSERLWQLSEQLLGQEFPLDGL